MSRALPAADSCRLADHRYCPTAEHLALLLSLLSAQGRESENGAQTLNRPPGIIILWNMAGLLLEDVELDENAELEQSSHAGEKRFTSRYA